MATKAKPKTRVYNYPSEFGSHAKMVDEELTKALKDTTKVVCKDEFGTYETFRNRLDNGLADPNRYESKRVMRLAEKEKK
jgi:hypothetical protein